MRKVNKLIIHCSATDNPNQDSLEAIELLHTSKPQINFAWGGYRVSGFGWSDVGYQFYIDKLGRIFKGRDDERPGAHCKGHNHDSVGICVGGCNSFNQVQIRALKELCESLCLKYCLDPTKAVFPHSHFNENKTCPNFELPEFEKWPDLDIDLTGDIEE